MDYIQDTKAHNCIAAEKDSKKEYITASMQKKQGAEALSGGGSRTGRYVGNGSVNVKLPGEYLVGSGFRVKMKILS